MSRKEHPLCWGKPPLIPFSIHLDQLLLAWLYTYVLAKVLQSCTKFIQKLIPCFKNHKEFGQLQTSSGKLKKLKFNGLLLSKKYIPSAKHMQRIYLRLLLTACVKTDQISHVIFETISYFSQHNSSLFKVHIFRLLECLH